MRSDGTPPRSAPQVFWGEMAPCDHVVQIYGDDQVFLDGLSGYVATALRSGDAAIVIATPAHLKGVEERLGDHGVELEAARHQQRYVTRDAEEMIGEFLVDGWPDEARFRRVVGELIGLARGDRGRAVRAFGEMVALLWAQGAIAATLELERLWTAMCEQEHFPLFCAYPRSGFTRNAAESLRDICRAHARVAPG